MFQNRCKSIVCQEDLYLKELVRYIHLNLLRGRLVEDLDRLNGNPWSGHSALAGEVDRPWQDTRYVLSYFGAPENSRNNYLAYVEKGFAQGHRPELVGGGLIRSLGGWSEVLASRKRGEKQAFDQRIPGDGDFVKLDDQVFFVVPPKASNPCASADLLDSGSSLRCARNDGRLGPVGGKNLIIE